MYIYILYILQDSIVICNQTHVLHYHTNTDMIKQLKETGIQKSFEIWLEVMLSIQYESLRLVKLTYTHNRIIM